MILLTNFDVPQNQYLEDADIIDVVGSIFADIWSGLDDVNVPGFDFSFADLLVAMLTATLIGFIVHVGFALLGRHKSHVGSSSVKRSGRHKGGN